MMWRKAWTTSLWSCPVRSIHWWICWKHNSGSFKLWKQQAATIHGATHCFFIQIYLPATKPLTISHDNIDFVLHLSFDNFCSSALWNTSIGKICDLKLRTWNVLIWQKSTFKWLKNTFFCHFFLPIVLWARCSMKSGEISKKVPELILFCFCFFLCMQIRTVDLDLLFSNRIGWMEQANGGDCVMDKTPSFERCRFPFWAAHVWERHSCDTRKWISTLQREALQWFPLRFFCFGSWRHGWGLQMLQ